MLILSWISLTLMPCRKESNYEKKQHTPKEKARLVLEALRGERTINEIASEHNVHPNMLSRWKVDAEVIRHRVQMNI